MQARAAFSDLHITQIKLCCLRAWQRVDTSGKASPVFTQQAGEPYTDFLPRLTTAIKKAISQEEAQRLILESLAYENASPDCRKAIQPFRAAGATIEDYIKVCTDVGSMNYQATLLAAAVKGEVKKIKPKCYNCGKFGHMKKDCRKGLGQAQTRGDNKQQPSGFCKRCGKGRHWTKDCRSVKDKRKYSSPSTEWFGNGQ